MVVGAEFRPPPPWAGVMSPSVTGELFSIVASTPAEGRLHGAAAAYGRASGSASLARGIDLAAGAEFGAHADASIRDLITAAVGGGASIKAGVALQASFPLDLFRDAGLVARFQAQAEA